MEKTYLIMSATIRPGTALTATVRPDIRCISLTESL